MQTLTTDILILGAGGAGLFAALHAKNMNPGHEVTIAVKGLLGKCGCTRMVQGGYNVALSPGDSIERHFMDTIEGGGWLNDQDLAWLLVSTAPSASANWKPNSAVSSTAIPTAPCIRKRSPVRLSTAPCIKAI